MKRSAQKQPTILDVSVFALLDAAARNVIKLTPKEIVAFKKMKKTTPVTLQGAMADAMHADAMALEFEAEHEDEVEEIEDEVIDGAIAGAKAARKAKTARRPVKPVKTETNVATEKAPEAKSSKKARASKIAAENKPKRAAKGEGQSRTPAARRARRILREYLRVALVASDENEEDETREAAQARATYLEEIIGREKLG